MNRLMILVCFFAVISAVSAEAPKLSWEGVRQAQLKREPGFLIIDVRPPAEYSAGHIQGVKNYEGFIP